MVMMEEELETMGRTEFLAAFEGVWEGTPWVTERAWVMRPFGGVKGLVAAMNAVVDVATERERRELIGAHPDLAGRLAAAGRLTAESAQEQAGAGLDALTDAEQAAFSERNAAYRARFGFPFVFCVRGHSKAGILAAFDLRLENSLEDEVDVAVAEIKKIAEQRVRDRVAG